MYKTQKF